MKIKIFECLKSVRNYGEKKICLEHQTFIPSTQRPSILYLRLSYFKAQSWSFEYKAQLEVKFCTSSNSDKFKGDFRTNFNEASPWCKIEDKVCIVNRAATTLDANFPLA